MGISNPLEERRIHNDKSEIALEKFACNVQVFQHHVLKRLPLLLELAFNTILCIKYKIPIKQM